MMHITNEMIDPELRQAGKVIRKVTSSLTPNKIRLINKATDVLRGVNRTNLNYEQHYITRPDGTKLRICVYSPQVPQENVPGILWIHGGGYALELPELEASAFAQLANETGAVIVTPDYYRSMDRPYPAALEDCYATLKWLRDHADDYGIRSDQLVVAGGSAGGGLTTALNLYARDKGEIAIAFQIAFYPMLDDRPTATSLNNDAPIWNTKSNEISWQLYLGDLYGTHAIPAYAAPARAEDLTGLPPMISFVGDLDPFYSETVTFIDRLAASGVPTYFKTYSGAYHAFNLIGSAEIAQDANRFLVDNFKFCMTQYFAEQPK